MQTANVVRKIIRRLLYRNFPQLRNGSTSNCKTKLQWKLSLKSPTVFNPSSYRIQTKRASETAG